MIFVATAGGANCQPDLLISCSNSTGLRIERVLLNSAVIRLSIHIQIAADDDVPSVVPHLAKERRGR